MAPIFFFFLNTLNSFITFFPVILSNSLPPPPLFRNSLITPFQERIGPTPSSTISNSFQNCEKLCCYVFFNFIQILNINSLQISFFFFIFLQTLPNITRFTTLLLQNLARPKSESKFKFHPKSPLSSTDLFNFWSNQHQLTFLRTNWEKASTFSYHHFLMLIS